jgi:hypothetical protein
VLSQQEFEAILGDSSKRIVGDLSWSEDEDHSPALYFRACIDTAAGHPLTVSGRFNALSGKLSFAIHHRSVGRICALDLGVGHRNPSGAQLGEKHKHRWTERHGDREAYVPEDITCAVDDPVGVWREFCVEATIHHDGTLAPPPARQLELGL